MPTRYTIGGKLASGNCPGLRPNWSYSSAGASHTTQGHEIYYLTKFTNNKRKTWLILCEPTGGMDVIITLRLIILFLAVSTSEKKWKCEAPTRV